MRIDDREPFGGPMVDQTGFIKEAPRGEEVDELWLRRIDDAVRWMTGSHNWNGWRSWTNAKLLCRGRNWSANVRSESDEHGSDRMDPAVTIPRMAVNIEGMVGYFTQSDPKFILDPRNRPDQVEQAKRKEALVNYTWEEQDFARPWRSALKELIITGNCILKTGYVTELDEAALLKAEETEGAKKKKGEVVISYDQAIKANYATLKHVPIHRFLYDLGAPDGTIKTARWVAELIVRPARDVMADNRYDAAARKAMQTGEETPQTYQDFRAANEDVLLHEAQNDSYLVGTQEYDHQNIVLAEIWDRRYKVRRVYALGVTKPLLVEDWPYPYLDDFPYIQCKFINVLDEPWGIGYVKLAQDPQKMLDRTRTKMAEHVKKFNAKLLTWGLDADERRRLGDDEHGAVINMGQGGKLENYFPPSLGQDFYRVSEIFANDLESLTLTDQMIGGGALPSRTSAEEVRTRTQLFGMKLSDASKAIDKMLHAVGQQTSQHIAANMEVDQVVRLLGEEGADWIKVEPEDVRVDTLVRVQSTSRQPPDPAREKQMSLDFLERMLRIIPALQQMQQQGGIPFDANKFLQWTINRMEDASLAEVFSGPAQPAQVGPGGPAVPGSPQEPNQAQSAIDRSGA
jgi:hypothetical protein